MGFKSFLTDLRTGWSTTLKKWSVQINGLQAVVLCALYAGGFPVWVVIAVCLVLVAASILAANLTQATVATIDPTKVDTIQKGTRDAANE